MADFGLKNKEWDIIRSLRDVEDISKDFIGGDCAYWEEKGLLVTTDHMAEGVHFDLSFMPPESVGWRLMAANASDILAMGGTPRYFLLNLAIPVGALNAAHKIIDGIKEFAKRYNIFVMGGDTTGGSKIYAGVTMFGERGDNIWKRSGAKPGDIISIAHYPGLSKAGLMHLKNGNSGFEESKERFLRPDPFSFRPFSGRITAAIDISDSLLSELNLISSFSGVTIEVDIDKIPVHEEVAASAALSGMPVESFLLGSGEEFFMLTASQGPVAGFFEIGRVTEKGEGNVVFRKNKRVFDISAVDVFSHFS